MTIELTFDQIAQGIMQDRRGFVGAHPLPCAITIAQQLPALVDDYCDYPVDLRQLLNIGVKVIEHVVVPHLQSHSSELAYNNAETEQQITSWKLQAGQLAELADDLTAQLWRHGYSEDRLLQSPDIGLNYDLQSLYVHDQLTFGDVLRQQWPVFWIKLEL